MSEPPGIPSASALTARRCPASERLVGVIQELSMARSLEGIQEIVRHAARELTGADGAAFVLRDGDQCFYADEDAIEPLWKGRRFPMTACISGWAMLNKEPAVIEDIFVDPRIPVEAYRPTFVKSLAMVPIRTRQPLGAIGNYWARRHRASDDELRLLQALADSSSIAIENVALLEELRAAKESAESASRLRDEFLATVSHELRTPLIPVVGWSALLLEETLSLAELREAAEAIHAGAHQELRLVEALLDVSQIIAGKLRLEPVRTRLDSIVNAAVEMIAPAAKAKGIRVDVAAGSGAGEAWVDPRRMQQIAWSLLSNAVKFTPSGGRIRVGLEHSPSQVQLVVADTGEGISPEFAPHIFERFRQADGSMTRAAGGMGLGLATVRHLVELHGGTVRAESPGRGLGATSPCRSRCPGARAPGSEGVPRRGEAADRAIRVAGEQKNDAMVRVLEAALAPLAEHLVSMGVRLPDRKAKRGGRRKKVEAA